ncbi:MAG: flavodoxin family protein [Dehalococcoidia bacterium]
MSKAVAINGSPRMERGCTAMVLGPFLEGMGDAGCDAELFYASRLKVKPCACGRMYCWTEAPGECCIKDNMQRLYPRLREAEILVLATPVYIPLPGDMQNLINRLCPLLDPVLEFREGRTRAMFRKDVRIRTIGLVSTGGWWEKENLATVARIAEELAADAGVKFAGAVLRPHASRMRREGELTPDGKAVLDAVQRAGHELVRDGTMSEGTLDETSRPLISREDFWSAR